MSRNLLASLEAPSNWCIFMRRGTARATSCAGLGTALGLLLTKSPQLLQDTTAVRVLQLLMERQQESSASRRLKTALSRSGLIEQLVKNAKLQESFWHGGKPLQVKHA